MKNYVAKLRENQEKGFSLVELIIVMAIMAILVGVVASQVIPYMEKSRQSKDQQQLSSLGTDIVSSIANAAKDVGDVGMTSGAATGVEATASSYVLFGDADVDQQFYEIRGESDTATALSKVAGKLTSKAATDTSKGNKKIYVAYESAKGIVYVWVPKDSSNTSYNDAVSKLKIKTE